MGKKKKKSPDNEHANFDPLTDNHPDDEKGYGCVWKHADSIKPRSSRPSHPCYYRQQGVLAAKDAKERYEEDNQDRAIRLGYLIKAFGKYVPSKYQAMILLEAKADQRAAQAMADGKPFNRANFVEKHKQRIYDPLSLLADDAKAWNVDYQSTKRPCKTFTLLDFGGGGSKYPYNHEWHHIIPMSGLNNHILDRKSQRGAAVA